MLKAVLGIKFYNLTINYRTIMVRKVKFMRGCFIFTDFGSL